MTIKHSNEILLIILFTITNLKFKLMEKQLKKNI